jgi:hypothetical protein
MSNDLLPLKGKILLTQAFNQILLHPETHEQGSWHTDCGTKHCLFGWVQMLNDRNANGGILRRTPGLSNRQDVSDKVCDILGLPKSGTVQDRLARSEASLAEQHLIIKSLVREEIDIYGAQIKAPKLKPFKPI